MSQFTQGEVQGAQILLKEFLNVLSGQVVLQVFRVKNFPEAQLMQFVALVSQLSQGD